MKLLLTTTYLLLLIIQIALIFCDQTKDKDEELLEKLLNEKLEKIRDEGPNNRLWHVLADDETSSHLKMKKIPKLKKMETSSKETHENPMMVRTTAGSREIDALTQIAHELREDIMGNVSLKHLSVKESFFPQSSCPFKQTAPCDSGSKFSRIDGSCNNLLKPWIGKSETPYKRYTNPAYDDRFGIPRTRARNGGLLPNVREISRQLCNENNIVDNHFTHMTAFFGQFITHDLSMGGVSAATNGGGLDCNCNNGDPNCFSVRMPLNEFRLKTSCMKMTRSSAAFSSPSCATSHREQLNLMTHFLDLTTVYGPNDGRANQLRERRGGLLKASSGVMGRQCLQHQAGCQQGQCQFQAGETRLNENLPLISIQTLFLREHNRLAGELSRFNPSWNDERLFNEARKILIAEYHNIIYNEYLPQVVGWNTAAQFGILPNTNGQYTSDYDTNVDPSVSNEFATAAFRFGHTLVRSTMGRFDRNNLIQSNTLNLSDTMFKAGEAYNQQAGGIESIFRSLINDPPSRFDLSIADTLQNHLFESGNSVFDLAALNLNRGRDHGIPSYNDFRALCGFPRASKFSDFGDFIKPFNIAKLQRVYSHVDDVDFYVGGLSEEPQNGVLVGSTFACIIANQFKDFKKGDRFYYENGPQNSPTAFNPGQLREIKKSSLASMICKNYDLNFVQPNCFLQPMSSPSNRRISCNNVPHLNTGFWQNV